MQLLQGRIASLEARPSPLYNFHAALCLTTTFCSACRCTSAALTSHKQRQILHHSEVQQGIASPHQAAHRHLEQQLREKRLRSTSPAVGAVLGDSEAPPQPGDSSSAEQLQSAMDALQVRSPLTGTPVPHNIGPLFQWIQQARICGCGPCSHSGPAWMCMHGALLSHLLSALPASRQQRLPEHLRCPLMPVSDAKKPAVLRPSGGAAFQQYR